MASTLDTLVVERLVVEGGFLDGLDLRFTLGMNVLIGERGAGKTSVIELMRFALGTQALTERFARLAREHTASVLGDGRVSVSYIADGERRTASRRVGDSEPEGDAPPASASPIVLSQNEIEAVGLDSGGRLRLIDGFIREPVARQSTRVGSSLTASIRSLSAEVQSLDRDIEEMRERVADREVVQRQLDEALVEMSDRSETAERASSQLPELNRLADETASRRVRATELERNIETVRAWRERLSEVAGSAPGPPTDPAIIGTAIDRLVFVLQKATQQLRDVVDSVAAEEHELLERLEDERRLLADLDDRARSLRLELERTQVGAGSAVRRVSELKDTMAQLDAVAQRLRETEAHRELRRRQRRDLLDQLDEFRDDRFRQRERVADDISNALGPRIRATVRQAGMRAEYSQAIVDLLKGSGLRYAQLAPTLAAGLSARELVEAVETNDIARVRSAAELSSDRAERLFYALRTSDLGSLLTTEQSDSVTLELLDGAEYKSTPVLSTGQRCTVVLPILLRHDERPLVIDQPEDHLDNAYVVDTVVRAVSARETGSQLILSTHNPNIPVLGDASQVTLMGSDGRRGFVRFSGALDDPRVVDAITTIMEGGADAFRRRAAFYDQVAHDS